jgi:predicted molibdopterin-dependent oxidoreductase YjgC
MAEVGGLHPAGSISRRRLPIWVWTGRNVYHFHTRTKTARSVELNAVAPEVYVEVNVSPRSTFGPLAAGRKY